MGSAHSIVQASGLVLQTPSTLQAFWSQKSVVGQSEGTAQSSARTLWNGAWHLLQILLPEHSWMFPTPLQAGAQTGL